MPDTRVLSPSVRSPVAPFIRILAVAGSLVGAVALWSAPGCTDDSGNGNFMQKQMDGGASGAGGGTGGDGTGGTSGGAGGDNGGSGGSGGGTAGDGTGGGGTGGAGGGTGGGGGQNDDGSVD